MSQEDKTTQDEAVNTSPETTEEAKPEVAPEAKSEEKTLEDVMKVDESPKEDKTIGLDKFLALKKEKKELEKKLKEQIEAQVKNDLPTSVPSADIDKLAKEYDVDPTFVEKLASTIRAGSEESIKEIIQAEVAPLKKKEQEARINKVFGEAYSKAIESMPEFKDIANPDAIKAIALNPANAKKTLSQVIEETYGNAITGKRSIENTTKPGGGKESAELDYKRAQTDSAYFKEVMNNPKLKEQYNQKNLNDVMSLL